MKILIFGICCFSGFYLTSGDDSTNETVFYDEAVTSINVYQRQRCPRNQRCNDPLKKCDLQRRWCVCKDNYEINVDGECICPEHGITCRACCEDNDCYNGYCTNCYEEDERNYPCPTEKMSFITASQIALCAAMFLGIIALSVLLWRICTKPEYLGRRTRANQSGNTSSDGAVNRSLSRMSISSVQIRILSRLRDRPPRYETNHNYEHQQRDAVERTCTQTIPEIRTLCEAPPSYDGSRNSISDRPPPYTVVITSEQGINNEGFVVEDEIVVNSCDEVLKLTTESANKTNSDKEIHI